MEGGGRGICYNVWVMKYTDPETRKPHPSVRLSVFVKLVWFRTRARARSSEATHLKHSKILPHNA